MTGSVLFSSSTKFTMLLAIAVISNGCSTDGDERPEYLDAQSVKSLEIPPKLTSPDTRGAVKFPEPSEAAMQQFKAAATRIETGEFNAARLKSDQGLNYLEIDLGVDKVWAGLPEFLASEGIDVEVANHHLSFVDTQWMDEYEITYQGEERGSWFSSFSPDYKDKFRIRLAGDKQQTKMFVAHRGMQIVVHEDVTAWQQRQSEAVLEREILYRYLLYIGAGKQQAAGVLKNYKTYQPRASAVTDNTDELKVMGAPQVVWMRLQLALDRLGVKVIRADKEQGMMLVRVGNLDLDLDSASEGNWFSRLFSDKLDLDDNEDYESGEYVKPKIDKDGFINVRLKQQAGQTSSMIKLVHENGAPVEDGLALDFRNALLLQLK